MKNRILIFLVAFLTCFSGRAQFCYHETSNSEIREAKQMIDSLIRDYHYFNYPIAIKQLNYVLQLADKHEDEQLKAAANFYLAHIFYRIQDYSEAEKKLQQSLVLQEKIDISEECRLYSYLIYSNIKLDQGNYQESIKYDSELDSINIEDNVLLISFKYATEAKKLIHEGDHARALILLNQAEDVLKNNQFNYELAKLYLLKANVFFRLQEYESALSYTERSLIIAQDNGFLLLVIQSYDQFSNIYEIQGQNNLALEYLKESNHYLDSVFNFNSNRVLLDEIRNAAANTISELSMANSEQEKSLKFNQLAIVLSVLLISILSLFTLSLYKNNNLRAKANKLLQNKNSELIKAKEKAESATKAKEQFLSTITHELRTPIYAITGLTYLLIKENPTEEQKEHLNSLKYSGEHLLSLINNILDLNKLEANKVRKINSNFDLRVHMRNFFNTLKKPADDKNVELHLEIDDKIPNKLNGDMLKVSQVLINLVGNSIKFSEGGDVWIRLSLANEEKQKVVVKFEIEDNGVGIPKNKQKSVFQKFDQGPKETNVKYGGTGLGLPIVKNLLLFLGSDIHLESEEGKGSKFSFDLSFGKVDEAEDAVVKLNLPKILSEDEEDVVFRGKRILVAEDNKLNQKITQRILEKRYMICDLADNGKIAVEKAAESHYDAILMDIHMPVMDGIEATEAIRHTNSEIPIIALTAVSINEELEEFLKHGFTEIIPKPYKTDLFFKKMYRVLAAKSQKTPIA